MGRLERRTRAFGSRVQGLISGAFRVGMVAATAAVAGGAVALGRSLGQATNAAETFSLVVNSLGPAAEGFNQRIAEIAETSRRSRFELAEGASTIIAMTRSMGAGQEQAADFGATFAQISTDLGSFFNQPTEQVFLDIRAALAGSSETLQKYGVDVRETTLKTIALNRGLIEEGETLDRLTRAMLIQSEIQRQAADAMEDAARTADSASNRIRGIQAVIRDTSTEIGLTFLPIWNEMLGVIEGFVRQAGPRLAAFVRTTVTDWLTGLAEMEGATVRRFGRILGFLVAFGQQIVQWGANIVAALAQGITGAIDLIVSAIKAIGRVIAFWLSPGSAPRLLPDIARWGRETAEEWIRGMTDVQLDTAVDHFRDGLSRIRDLRQDIRDEQRLGEIEATLEAGGLSDTEIRDLMLEAQEIETRRTLRQLERAQGRREAEEIGGAAAAGRAAGEGIAAGIASAAAEIQGAVPTIEELGILPDFEDQFKSIRELIDTELKPGFEEGQKAAREFAFGVEAAIDQLLINLGLIEEAEPTRAGIFGVGEPGADPAAQASVFDRIGEAVGRFGDRLSDFAKAIDNLDMDQIARLAGLLKAIGIGIIVGKTISGIAGVVSALSGLGGILSAGGAIVSGLIWLVGIMASAVSGISGVASALSGLVALLGGPVTLVIAGIVIAVGALALAWRRDFGGIQTKTREVWEQHLEPAFEAIGDWFEVKIPEAIAFLRKKWQELTNWWNETFIPATEDVIGWFSDLWSGIDDLTGENGPIGRLIGWFGDLQSAASDLWEKGISKLADLLPGSPPPLAEGIDQITDATRDLARRGSRNLLGFIHAARRDRRRVGLASLFIMARVAGEEFLNFLEDSLLDGLERVQEFVEFDLLPTFEDFTDFLDRTAIDAFERLRRASINVITNVGDAIIQINAAIQDLNQAPLDAVSAALGNIQADLADIAADLTVLERIRDVLSEIEGIDIGDILIELGLSTELDERLQGILDRIDLNRFFLGVKLDEIDRLVRGGGTTTLSVLPRFNFPSGPQLAAGTTNNVTLNINATIRDEHDLTLLTRQIMRHIQELSG